MLWGAFGVPWGCLGGAFGCLVVPVGCFGGCPGVKKVHLKSCVGLGALFPHPGLGLGEAVGRRGAFVAARGAMDWGQFGTSGHRLGSKKCT